MIYYTVNNMIELQIRRHSIQGNNKHLSPAGVKLAKMQNEDLFDLVITSPIQRAMETALCLGSAITETHELLGFLPENVQSSIPFSAGFRAFQEAINTNKAVSECARIYRQFILACVSDLKEPQRALFISHAGTVEMLILACLPNLQCHHFPDSVSQLEGASLTYDGLSFNLLKSIRVGPSSEI